MTLTLQTTIRVVKCGFAHVRATNIDRTECKVVLVRNTIFLFFHKDVKIIPVQIAVFKFSTKDLSFLMSYLEANDQPRKIRVLCGARYEYDDWEQHIQDVKSGGYKDLFRFESVVIPSDIQTVFLFDLFYRNISLSIEQFEQMLSYLKIRVNTDLPDTNVLDLTNMKRPVDYLLLAQQTLGVSDEVSSKSPSVKSALENSPIDSTMLGDEEMERRQVELMYEENIQNDLRKGSVRNVKVLEKAFEEQYEMDNNGETKSELENGTRRAEPMIDGDKKSESMEKDLYED